MCTSENSQPGAASDADQTGSTCVNEDASELLTRVLYELDNQSVSIGELSGKFYHRSFGGVIAVLALLGLVPGISFVAGAVIMVLGVQMMFGSTTPVLPGLLARRTVKVEKLRNLLANPIRFLVKLETVIKPRWSIVFHPGSYRLLGIVVFLLALAMVSPLPLSNVLPAIALVHMALGFLERDGVAIITGLLSSAIAIASGIFLLMLAVELAGEIWSG